jgi:hypothetical protein
LLRLHKQMAGIGPRDRAKFAQILRIGSGMLKNGAFEELKSKTA